MNGRIVKEDTGLSVLADIGKVKIGEKTDKGYPKSLDHFIGYGKYKSLFDKAFPEKPNRIPIVFISDSPSYSCNERMELRDKAGKLFSSGDGYEFRVWDSGEEAYKLYNVKAVPDLVSRTEKKVGGTYSRILTLRFIIPKIRGVLGMWSLETKADKSSIDKIVQTFDYVSEHAGTVTRVLFDLCVEKHTSQKPDSKSSYPVLSLIPNVSDENLMQLKEFYQSGMLLNVPYITDDTLPIKSDQKMLNEFTKGVEDGQS